MKNKIEILFIFFVLVIFTIVFAKYYYPELYSYTVRGSENSIRMNLDYLKYKVTLFKDTKINLADANNNDYAKSVPVLNYHGIANTPYKNDILIDNFAEQMVSLKEAGYTTVTLEEFYAFMRNEKPLPDKSVLITFDDGIKSSYYKSDPLFRALDYNAVIFLISKQSTGSGSNYYLSKDEVNDMIDTGRWEIQAHANGSHDLINIDLSGRRGHFMSDKIWSDDLQRLETDEEFEKRIYHELSATKGSLEQAFNLKVNSFAFPFGDFGQISINHPGAKDYVLPTALRVYPDGIFYQVWANKGATDNYPVDAHEKAFKRITVQPSWDGKDLIDILKNSHAKDLPFSDNFDYNKGWISVSGDRAIGNNLMVLKPLSSNSTFVFLDGSYLFKDYTFKAKIEPFRGETVSLIARFKDDTNYVSCDFAQKVVRIREYNNGNTTVIAEVRSDSYIPHLNSELGVAVNNNNVECSVNGEKIIEAANLNNEIKNGAVGFKTWDTVNDAQLIVREVIVEQIDSS